MRAAANCTISIQRGTTTNTYGDEVDGTTSVATGIPASIIEQTRRAYIPAEAATRIIRSYAGRVGSEVTILKGDRVTDHRGRIYLVVDVAEPESAALQPDKSFTLSRTT